MTYTRRLALALRSRGADEDTVNDVLREIQGFEANEEQLTAEFGAPEEYATRVIPIATKRTGRLLIAAVLLAVAWVLLGFIGMSAGWDMFEAMQGWMLLPAVAILAVGIFLQFSRDARLNR